VRLTTCLAVCLAFLMGCGPNAARDVAVGVQTSPTPVGWRVEPTGDATGPRHASGRRGAAAAATQRAAGRPATTTANAHRWAAACGHPNTHAATGSRVSVRRAHVQCGGAWGGVRLARWDLWAADPRLK